MSEESNVCYTLVWGFFYTLVLDAFLLLLIFFFGSLCHFCEDHLSYLHIFQTSHLKAYSRVYLQL